MVKSRNLKLSEKVEFLNINKKYMHAYSRQPGGKNLLGISMPTVEGVTKMELKQLVVSWAQLTLILRRSRTGTVWFYTSTSNKRAARPKLYTKSLTRDLKLMYSCLTLVRISIKL